MLFLKVQNVFGLLVLCTLHTFFVEMSPTFSSQPQPMEIISKNVGDKEYIVKTSFTTFSTTQKSADDEDGFTYDDLKLDESFSSFCDDIEFECASDHHCIPIESYCDGTNDCADESDELTCASTPKISFLIINTTPTTALKTIIILLSIIILIKIIFRIYKKLAFS